MTDTDTRLETIIAAMPATRQVIDAVLAAWPDHRAYLTKNFALRSAAVLAATEVAAAASLKLMAGDTARFAGNYRWTCDQLRDEEIFFHREGRYRLNTFADAYAEVYSQDAYMSKYVDGLLLTQILWYNHATTFEMFLNRVLAPSGKFDYLEVGPGHGLMVYFAAQSPHAATLAAWDVSATSLAETRAALDVLGVTKPVSLVEVDILKAEAPAQKYDLIVMSEVLEHLETPGQALAFLRQAIRDDGRLFVNVPLNSPSPDHIYLFATPDDVTSMVEAAGFRVVAVELYATQGRDIAKALANRISVSAGIIAVPA